MFKETVRSLRMYFILVAIVGGLSSGFPLTQVASLTPYVTIDCLIGLGLSAAFLYIGISLKHLLATAPHVIKAVLFGGIGLSIMGDLIGLFMNQPHNVISTIATVLISWYLIVNVNRLAAESQE
jgi:hypothetical protein